MEELTGRVEAVMASIGSKKDAPKGEYLDRLASGLGMELTARYCGTVCGEEHMWLAAGEYIVDPYADDYHFRLSISTELLRRGGSPHALGVCVARAVDMPIYAGTRMDVDSSRHAPREIEPVRAPPPPDTRHIPVWRLGATGQAAYESTDPLHAVYPQTVTDLNGATWKYRIDHADNACTLLEACNALHSTSIDASIAITVRARGTLHADDMEALLLPLIETQTKRTLSPTERFTTAANVMVGCASVQSVAFDKATSEYPFVCMGMDHQTREIAERCVAAAAREIVVGRCMRSHLQLTVKGGLLVLVRKVDADVLDMTMLSLANEAARRVREYMSLSVRASPLKMSIHTDLLEADVTQRARTIYIGERHMSEFAMDLRTTVKEMVPYGQATVSDFEDDRCVLTVHPDLRFFIGTQRARSVRALRSARKSAPLLMSKGMFRADTALAPLSAQDTVWRTYHPSTYVAGEMRNDFNDVAVEEMEPLILKDKYALVCKADMTAIHIHPTVACFLDRATFEIVLADGRSICTHATMSNGRTFVHAPAQCRHAGYVARAIVHCKGHTSRDIDVETIEHGRVFFAEDSIKTFFAHVHADVL